ncbi:hypothetical protein [Acinetobacter soli]|uniref:hypothetical protein n=1 Tax=Acinetobacter soli TaxID=487316 RepID=UPI003A8B6DC1
MDFIPGCNKYEIVDQLIVWSKPCITENGIKIHGAAALSKSVHEAIREVLGEIKLTQSVTAFYDSCSTALTSH